MGKVKFSFGTLANYKAITSPDSDTLYFMSDEPVIYKGTQLFTDPVELITTGDFPTIGAEGRIYIKSSTLEGKIYTGGNWITINKGISTTITDSATDNELATAKAIATYVQNKIASVTAGSGVFVTGVELVKDEATNNPTGIMLSKGEDTSEVSLTGFLNNATYNAETRTITLSSVGEDDLVISLGKDAFVQSGAYDSENGDITLTLTNGDTVTIPASDLVDIYTGKQSSSATTTVSTDNEISVSVRVSAEDGNALQIKTDGLYVEPVDVTDKLSKVDAGHLNEVIIASADGSIKVSGVKIGGATLAETPSASTLATEIAVNAIRNAIDSQFEEINTALESKIDTSKLVTTITKVDNTTIPTEGAVLNAISWVTH